MMTYIGREVITEYKYQVFYGNKVIESRLDPVAEINSSGCRE